MQVLTDEEIVAVAKQYSGDKSTVEFWFARAIEAAILEKLSSSEPVCWADLKTLQRMQVPQFSRVAFQTYLRATYVNEGSIPLFTHPQVPSAVEAKYNELLLAVQRKFPDETRHETALRYIKTAEAPSYTNAARSDK